MLFRTTLGRLPVTVSLTRGALTIGCNDQLVVAWDLGGRLYSVVDGDRTWRRGLNGRVLEKWREDGERRRRSPGNEESAAIVDRAAALARDVQAHLPTDRGIGVQRDSNDRNLGAVLDRCARFDGRAAAADAAAFAAVYRPIGILPPDQYLALVLQATEGCSFRSCTFCDFYREPYRVRDAAQFGDHVAAVRRYLGDSMALRGRAIFLGSANALAVPMPGLLPIFDTLAREFPATPVHAFLDGFTGTRKTPSDYRALAARGLRRVYIGLESGHDPLLAFVRKPSTSGQVIETAHAMKSGGVNVAVIAMVGLGGARFADAHAADTAAAINAMNLGAGDLLYLSELVTVAGSPYLEQATAAGIRPLTSREVAGQRRAIEARLTFPGAAPRIATYDVREFVY